MLEEILRHKKIAPMLGARIDPDTVIVHPSQRGHLKQALLKVGWPAEDEAGYVDGEAHHIELDTSDWHLRSYQEQAVEGFWAGGSGVVVLPCGAGKTLVGAAAMAKAGATTLILVTNTVVRPAVAAGAAGPDLADRGGDRRVLRRTQGDPAGHHRHLPGDDPQVRRRLQAPRRLFDSRDWGLVIYDEVHLLPAPVFRMTADLQSRRRLGLTATLVREDGREGDVFSLIGPKRYDAPWKDIESQGWIAPAECTEVRVTLTDAERLSYATAEPEERYKIASTARTKMPVVRSILDRHPGEPTLVIGAYLEQLEELGEELQAPIIQGSTRNAERERLYDAFRHGEVSVLVVSKVANFSIDLPDATVAIQVSGHVRLPAGGGAAARPDPAAQGRRPAGALLLGGRPGHPGHRLRRAPAAVPGRAGLRLPDRRRRRPARAGGARDGGLTAMSSAVAQAAPSGTSSPAT